jgi:amino acid adenylation domain-containing protein
VADLDQLPYPDRSLVNYNKYHPHLGHAMAKRVIVIQASRGCPYHCAYCHKIWPKKHVFRSARHIFDEVKFHYDLGIRRFAFVDDIFNLAKKNSTEFFQMILDHDMDVQFFFPNGLRGDILTKEFIDLMVEAGTVSLALALETGSPRLQKEIAKNLNLDRFRENAEYICRKHPQVITELFTMHGFPGETEDEAMKTLDFIKSLKWIHFPYINILKVYPGTDMERMALENGVSRESILRSENYAHFELSDNLPFERNFTMHYRSELLNNYFLNKERLLQVLPLQMDLLTEDELLQKYNSYLPVHIADFQQLLRYLGIEEGELDGSPAPQPAQDQDYHGLVSAANKHLRKAPSKDALKVLLLDLSQFFRKDSFDQYDVEGEAPIGLMYVLTYLNRELGEKVNGRIAKARIDFDSYGELKQMLDEFQPDIIGVRTLSLLKDFLHQTVSVIKQWLPDVPVVAGGPYATTDYRKALMDTNIDLVVMGEGEVTFADVARSCIANSNRLPDQDTLEKIPGIAFVDRRHAIATQTCRPVVLADLLPQESGGESTGCAPINQPQDPAYVIYTSGSTGTPKGVVIEHRNLEYLVEGLNARIYSQYSEPLNVALVAPLVFDASVKQVFAALLGGHSLYIVPEDVRRDSVELLKFYKDYDIQLSDCTPAHLALLAEIEEAESPQSLPVKRFLAGGEVLGTELARRFYRRFGEDSLLTNVYGPTECAVDATTYDAAPDAIPAQGGVPVGRPLPHCRVYVLNQWDEPMPVGIPGELCIAGSGVGRGYLNDTVATTAAFVPDPFIPGGRMYRTGDLARWLPDGNLLVSGRVDQQVKIRGYRVELEDIRHQCLKHPKVEDAVVVTRSAENDEQSLVAYVVTAPEVSLDMADIHDFLAGELPPHMIPTYVVQLETIPLNRNGKVDRKALPEPQLLKGKRYSAPRHRLDAQLQAIWGDVLGVEEGNVGIDDDFFQLGGHSLKATILVARIHKELRKKIPLQAIFKDPTIRGIAGYLEECGIEPFQSIPVAPELEYYELAGAQKRLFFLQQMDPAATAYNLALLANCEGTLDTDKLRQAFQEMIRRHESLRTSFHLLDHLPKQKIHSPMDIPFDVIEAQGPDVETAVQTFITPFDLAAPPLLKAGAIKTGAAQWIVMIMTHHIISDGTSQEIFLRELLALYRGETLPELSLQYKDYCQWQSDPKERRFIEEREDFWRAHFEGEPEPLSLPTDFPRPEDRDYRGKRTRFTIEPRLASPLKELAQNEDATLYMTLLAAFNAFLFCLTGQEDIVVGTPQAGRGHAELQSLIGLFVNTLAIRNFPRRDASFRSLLQDVRTRVRDALANQDYPFEDLVRLTQGDNPPAPGRNPMFDVVMALQNMEMARIQLPDLTVTPHDYMDPVSRFDLGFFIEEQDNGLLVLAEFSAQLFTDETIQRMINHFVDVVEAVAADPGILLRDIRLTGEKTVATSAVSAVDFGF